MPFVACDPSGAAVPPSSSEMHWTLDSRIIALYIYVMSCYVVTAVVEHAPSALVSRRSQRARTGTGQPSPLTRLSDAQDESR